MLVGQRLNLRQAGLCGVATWFAGADIRLHISALLCFALLIFVDHHCSQPVISVGFAPTPLIPR